MKYILYEYDFTDVLNSYVSPPISFDSGVMKLTQYGITLNGRTKEGQINMPISASKLIGIIGGNIFYKGNLSFAVFDADTGMCYKLYNDGWVIDNLEHWYSCEDFYTIGLFSNIRKNLVIHLKFDTTTLLNSVQILVSVDIDDYWYYIHTKFSDFLTSKVFMGRLVCDNIITEKIGGNYAINLQDITPVGGYNNVSVFSIRNSSGNEIFDSKDNSYVYVTEELDGTSQITVYFNYTCNIKINQSLDFVEIEQNPTLVVDQFTITPTVEDSFFLPVYGCSAHSIFYDNKWVWVYDKIGYKCQSQRGIGLDFNLIISSNLYYDSLMIWEELFSNSFIGVELPEVGSHFILEIVKPTRETVPLNTEGGRVLYSRVTIRFPYPVKIEDSKIVKSKGISGYRKDD